MKKWIGLVGAVLAIGLAGCNNPADTPTKTPVAQSSKTMTRPAVRLSLASALAKFSAQYEQAELTGVTVRRTQSVATIELAGVQNKRVVELTLDATSGKLVHASDKARTAAKPATITQAGLESLSTVTKIATGQVGSGTATKWVLTQTGGRTVWTVTVPATSATTKVKIDAYSGEILNMKKVKS